MSIWGNPRRDELHDKYPLETLTFLRDHLSRASTKFTAKTIDDITPDTILSSYKWLICYLLHSTSEQFQKCQRNGMDAFTTRNDNQIYLARTLSLAFIEHYVMEQFWEKLCLQPQLSESIKQVLVKLLLLYGLWSLEKHLGTLYQGGHLEGPQPANVIRSAILQLCQELKGEAVSLVDVIAPPDFILNSCLGRSDGQVYKHLQLAMMQTPKAFERDENWKEIASRLKPKL